MNDPIAYMLTWTCYGTWLPGDVRGSVDHFHRIPHTPYMAVDHVRRKMCMSNQEQSHVLLNPKGRVIVTQAIRDHCDYKNWQLYTVNVRSNHVHVVIASSQMRPEMMMIQLKAYATRYLRKLGILSPDKKVWSKHGSTRYLWNDQQVSDAIHYVQYGQDRRQE